MTYNCAITRTTFFISLLLVLLQQQQQQVKANPVVIECIFPCLSPNNVCEVSNDYVKCTPRTSQIRWVLENTTSLPQYQGESSDVDSSCVTAPQPSTKLKDASHVTTNTNETIIDWPSYDMYYSNCIQGTYCDKANMCVKQLIHGQVCECNSQCLTGLVCSENTCQDVAGVVVPTTNQSNHTGYDTVHITLTLVGIVLFLGLVVIAFFICRRKRRLSAAVAAVTEETAELNIPVSKTVTTTRRLSNSSCSSSSSSCTVVAAVASSSLTTVRPHHHQQAHHDVITNILQRDYESVTTSLPSQQQQELQFQLLKIQHSPSVTTTAGQQPPPPPPYAP